MERLQVARLVLEVGAKDAMGMKELPERQRPRSPDFLLPSETFDHLFQMLLLQEFPLSAPPCGEGVLAATPLDFLLIRGVCGWWFLCEFVFLFVRSLRGVTLGEEGGNLFLGCRGRSCVFPWLRRSVGGN